MQTHLPIERPNSFFTCASGGLGHSLPAAVGIALAVSSRGTRHRAVRRRLRDVLDPGAVVGRQSQAAADHRHREQRRLCGTGEFSSHFNIKQLVGTRLPGIDFVGLARSLGCEAVRVERPQDLGPTLTAALQSSVPYLVDVAVRMTGYLCRRGIAAPTAISAPTGGC